MKNHHGTTGAVGSSTGFVAASLRDADGRERPVDLSARIIRSRRIRDWRQNAVNRRIFRPHSSASRRDAATFGFTLVELLVVIAIIGILVALLLPAIQAAREAARRTQCQNHMKQLGLATLNYESNTKRLPPSKWLEFVAENKAPLTQIVAQSTMTYLLPYVEEGALADRWNWKQTWSQKDPKTSPNDNFNIKETPIPTFRCPTAPQERDVTDSKGVTTSNPAAVDYRVCEVMASNNAGNAIRELIAANKVTARPNSKNAYHSVLFNEVDGNTYKSEYAKLKQTTDGLSQTMMWFETGAAPVRWKDGQPVPIGGTLATSGESDGGNTWADYANFYHVHNRCGDSFFNCNNIEEIYSFHVGGAYFTFGDAAVHFINQSIDPDVFVSLFTRDSNDIITENQF